MIGIYSITNSVNKKRYIGQSINIIERWRYHKKVLRKNVHNNAHLQKAWNLFGENSFEFIVLEECSKEDLSKLEKKWSDYYNTENTKCGYNIRKTGEINFISEETKKKISIAKKGITFSDSHKNNLSKNHFDFSRENGATFGKKMPNSSSVFYGVSYRKDRSKWCSQVVIDGKHIFLGNFAEEKLAALAYDNYVTKNKLSNPLNFIKEANNVSI